MRAKKAKAIRRMVRRFAQEDVLMGDERTARYFWRRPDGLLIKSAGQQPPVDGAKPILATYTLTYRPGGFRHLQRLTKRQLRQVQHG